MLHFMLGFFLVVPTLAGTTDNAPPALGIYQMPKALATELGLRGGAVVLHVVPRSPADRAGIQPGDVITMIERKRVESFEALFDQLKTHAPGDVIDLTFRRVDVERSTQATLAKKANEIGDVGYKRSLEFLKGTSTRFAGPELPSEISGLQWNLGDRDASLKTLAHALEQLPNDESLWDRYLDVLHKLGKYRAFVEKSEEAARRLKDKPKVQLHYVNALLATGRLHEAESLASQWVDRYFQNGKLIGIGNSFHAMWADARIRLAQPLSDPRRPATLANYSSPELAVMEVWRDLLNGARPYERIKGDVTTIPFQTSSVMLGFIPNRMHGISIRINGVEVPLAIVDTGASHTLIANDIAELAKIEVGGKSRGAFGSLNFTAKAGLIREIQIGSIVLRNVPVNVGNPPPLAMTKAKAALGLDLMHQIRFVLDYAAGKARIEPADLPPEKSKELPWDIPLYTFSDHTLSEGSFSNGASARVLIDSGNFALTLMWPTWGKLNVANHPGPAKDMFAFASKFRTYKVKDMQLGGRTLPPWPVMDMPPATLQGVDLIDLLMGHDLLSQYRTTVDMKARRLRLETPGQAAKSPESPPDLDKP